MRYWIMSKTDDLSKRVKERIIEKLPFRKDKINPDLVITIGGDGTFLRACHHYPNALFLGIHTGHLGFYANFNYKEIDKVIDFLIKGAYNISKIPLLSCEVTDNSFNKYYALNEITLVALPRTLIVDAYINENFLEEIRGTGVCISTPSGSTAYNKSIGGAIIDHSILSMQLVEIAGINSNSFSTLGSPLVLGADNEITLEAASLYKKLYLTVDNQCYELNNFKSLKCKIGETHIKVIKTENINFLDRVKRAFLK